MYCFWILSNKRDLNPETSFYYKHNIFIVHVPGVVIGAVAKSEVVSFSPSVDSTISTQNETEVVSTEDFRYVDSLNINVSRYRESLLKGKDRYG